MMIQYQPQGVCSRLIQLEIENDKIVAAQFVGGCNGNTKGICSLIIGMNVDDVIRRLSGITCGGKPTSCPDQLARCLMEYKRKTSL